MPWSPGSSVTFFAQLHLLSLAYAFWVWLDSGLPTWILIILYYWLKLGLQVHENPWDVQKTWVCGGILDELLTEGIWRSPVMLDRILKERRQVRTRKRRQGFVLQQGWSLQGVVEEAQSMKSLSSERFRTCLYTHSFIHSSIHPSTYHSIYFFF